MKETPILFSAPMVRAILEGRKTMTRRVVKPQPKQYEGGTSVVYMESGEVAFQSLEGDTQLRRCPYGQPGSRLWVRETWGLTDERVFFQAENICYLADGRTVGQRYRPSIFMPRWASRIILEITSIRVERVQEITEEDARAEGIEGRFHPDDPKLWTWRDYGTPGRFAYGIMFGAVQSFQSLWNSINSKRGFGWDANPWVWVVGFRRVEK